ncbi:MAG TPA: hypothetical protein EYO90_01495 [Candidatus Latescibacteria bacterium]|nr:hypothetical protein [Candidatus Latescibacterota bacterium]
MVGHVLQIFVPGNALPLTSTLWVRGTTLKGAVSSSRPDITLGDADGFGQFHQIDEDITVWRHGKTDLGRLPQLRV